VKLMQAAGGPVAAAMDYARRLQEILAGADWSNVARLGEELLACWRERRQVFLCGNGGSAGNAIHLANDFLYGISKTAGSGLRVTALSANSSVLTCLANDEGYEDIFALQLAVLAQPGDVLIALSGSGNSPNIVRALEQARTSKLRSFAILGYQGGKAKQLADVAIHFPVEDMQISEDLQLIAGHMIMQWLYSNRSRAA
jgi:D-sedoheptulose 7-phosphate isomerase